ncbi:MAG: alpha/beta hydrolase family esterase [Pseudomonadota bacterium]
MATRTFAPNPGALEMLLHAPPDLAAGAPLVVALHGCTQSAAAFAEEGGWLTLADQLGFAVLAPQQSSANNPNRCFNWFEARDMRRGDGEPASIAAMIAEAIATHDLDPRRIYIMGLSAGGAMAAVMLAAYPDLFAGGAIVAGLPYGVARGAPQAFQAMKGRAMTTPAQLAALIADAGGGSRHFPPLSVWHGDADSIVHVGNATDIARQWAAVQGLASDPDSSEVVEGRHRSVWRAPDGLVKIEVNRVPGLGHGVPLETGGEAGLGRTAPFMLEAGVSATLEIARFWELPGAAARRRPVSVAAEPSVPPAVQGGTAPAGALHDVGAQVMSAVSSVSADAQKVIAEALRRGGLLK